MEAFVNPIQSATATLVVQAKNQRPKCPAPILMTNVLMGYPNMTVLWIAISAEVGQEMLYAILKRKNGKQHSVGGEVSACP
jgi:hypothetical protein